MIDSGTVIFGLSVATWTTGLLVVVLIAVAHAGLRWWIRRKVRRDEKTVAHAPGETPAASYWIARGLNEAVPPLALLLWVNGLHFALSTLLSDLVAIDFARHGMVALNWLQGLGTLLALAWLLVRIGRTIDALLLSLASRTDNNWDDVLAPFAGKAVRLTLPLLAIILGTQIGRAHV